MRKTGLKSIALNIICFSCVAGMIAGCTSTKNFLGYLKFWGPKQEAAENGEAREVAVFSSQVRPVLKGNPDSHYLLAVHYQQRGRHHEAIEEFRKVVLIDPDHAKAYNGLGVSYDNLKEFDNARESYRTAIRLAPEQDYIYNNLGYSLALAGDYEAAAEILQKGIALNPNNEQMHNNLTMAYAGMGKNELALAELQRTKEPAPARLELAKIHQHQGRVEDAAAFFAEATSLDPSLKDQMKDKDRFVAEVSRSIKGGRQAKTALLRKDWNMLKVENLPVTTTKRILISPVRIDNGRPPTIIALPAGRQSPDLFRQEAGGTINNDIVKKPDKRAVGLIQERLPVTFVTGTVAQDHYMGKKWF